MSAEPNITEQMYRETSEHFMAELNKKNKIIQFLKSRLKEVQHQKNHIEKLRDKIKYALLVQHQMMDAANSNIYELVGELGNRTQSIADTTRSIDGDIEDFMENYSDTLHLNITDSDIEDMI